MGKALMDQLLTKPIQIRNIIISSILLLLGFLNLSFGWIDPLGPYSLAIAGIASFLLTFGKASWLLFSRPIKPIKNFFIFFVLTVVVSLGTSILLQAVLNLKLKANPLSNHIPWLQLPGMLLGEELLSFFVFVAAAILLSRFTHNILFANLISAFIFALLHVPTYWNGNLFLTLFHVLALQGVTRIIFNTSGIKSNTLLVPLMIHILFDVYALLA